MRKHLWRILIAGILVGAAAQAASAAESAIVEPAGAVSQPSLGLVTLASSAWTMSCTITLSLRLNEGPITAALNAAIGSLTGVRIRRPCNDGEIRAVLVEARNPWPMTIQGALELDTNGRCVGTPVQPEAADPERLCGLRVKLEGFAYELSVFGGFVNCLWGGPGEVLVLTTELVLLGENTYAVGLLVIETPNSIRFNSGSFLCPGLVEVIGSFGGPEPAQTLIAV